MIDYTLVFHTHQVDKKALRYPSSLLRYGTNPRMIIHLVPTRIKLRLGNAVPKLHVEVKMLYQAMNKRMVL